MTIQSTDGSILKIMKLIAIHKDFSFSTGSQKLTIPFVRWPCGKPSEAVNMYLLDNIEAWTGDTAVQAAYQLVHLVRYCFFKRIYFSDLADENIGELISNLLAEKSRSSPHLIRNNNTVIAIAQSCLNFLEWFQKNLHFDVIPLIGLRSSSAKIAINYKRNSKNGVSYIVHRYTPTPESTNPKLPIALKIIEQTNAVIESRYHPEAYAELAVRKFNGDDDYFFQFRDYLTNRREFMIRLLRWTGLRPGEMILMSAKVNYESLSLDKPYFVIPTLKRRRRTPPLRHFRITKQDASMFLVYLKSRAEWFSTCQLRNPELQASDAIFLSTHIAKDPGTPITKSAIEKDFRYLCSLAGLDDHQTCFSMFRHRFITEQVLLHLKEMGLQRDSIQLIDYRTILERVREKTGHGSIDSLWHYIDLAFDFADIFKPVDQAIQKINSAQLLLFEIRRIERDILSQKLHNMTGVEVCEYLRAKLESVTMKT